MSRLENEELESSSEGSDNEEIQYHREENGVVEMDVEDNNANDGDNEGAEEQDARTVDISSFLAGLSADQMLEMMAETKKYQKKMKEEKEAKEAELLDQSKDQFLTLGKALAEKSKLRSHSNVKAYLAAKRSVSRARRTPAVTKFLAVKKSIQKAREPLVRRQKAARVKGLSFTIPNQWSTVPFHRNTLEEFYDEYASPE